MKEKKKENIFELVSIIGMIIFRSSITEPLQSPNFHYRPIWLTKADRDPYPETLQLTLDSSNLTLRRSM